MRNIPYGETNFRKLRLENNLYVDKTSFQRISEFARDKRKQDLQAYVLIGSKDGVQIYGCIR